MSRNQLLGASTLALVLVACGVAPISDRVEPPETSVYMAEGIANRQVNFVWMELPLSLNLGSNDIRVFMARTEPPGMVVPTEVELPCIVQPENEYQDLRPVALPFEFDGKELVGSYTWNACASCVECYMDWDTTMEIVGTVQQDRIDLSIGIRHMGLNIQDDYLRIELLPEETSSSEPRIMCRRSNDCMAVEFALRLEN